MKSFPRFTRSQDRRRITAIALCIALAVAAIAQACNVPVFRFALERWRPDAYRLTVFHRGALTPSDRELLQTLAGGNDNP